MKNSFCDIESGKCVATTEIDKEETIEKVANKVKLVYVSDPICSSCFAFAPEIIKIKKEFEDILEFQMIMGGLRPHGTERISAMKEYLTPHFMHVKELTGLPVNLNILDSDFVVNTEPPCRAVVVMRNLCPERELEFAEHVQKLFYIDNKDTSDVNIYLKIVKDFGVDQESFRKLFESDEIKTQVKADFRLTRKIKVKAFPTLLLEQEGRYTLLTKGYCEAQEVINKLRVMLSE